MRPAGIAGVPPAPGVGACPSGEEAKTFELRTATSAAPLWQCQGNRDAARDVLAPVYERFAEGFDTRDLKGAKALLAQLG